MDIFLRDGRGSERKIQGIQADGQTDRKVKRCLEGERGERDTHKHTRRLRGIQTER